MMLIHYNLALACMTWRGTQINTVCFTGPFNTTGTCNFRRQTLSFCIFWKIYRCLMDCWKCEEWIKQLSQLFVMKSRCHKKLYELASFQMNESLIIHFIYFTVQFGCSKQHISITRILDGKRKRGKHQQMGPITCNSKMFNDWNMV